MPCPDIAKHFYDSAKLLVLRMQSINRRQGKVLGIVIMVASFIAAIPLWLKISYWGNLSSSAYQKLASSRSGSLNLTQSQIETLNSQISTYAANQAHWLPFFLVVIFALLVGLIILMLSFGE